MLNQADCKESSLPEGEPCSLRYKLAASPALYLGFHVVMLEKKQVPHTVQHSLSMLLLRWDLDKFTT